MADTKISALPVATTIVGTEVIPIVQGTTTSQVAANNLLAPYLAVLATTISGLVTKTRTINAQTDTTYTLVLGDASNLVTLNNASPVAVTIPTNAVVAFPVGTQIDFIQEGAGKVTFSGAGVTINSQASNKAIAAQYVGVSLIKQATDTWYLIGALIA